MTTAAHILLSFSNRGVVLSSHRGRLRIDAPHGELTAEDREVLAANKAELLVLIKSGGPVENGAVPRKQGWKNAGFGFPDETGYTFRWHESHENETTCSLADIMEDVPPDSRLWLTDKQKASMAERLRRNEKPVWPELLPPIDFDAADLPIAEWEDEPPATAPPADDPAKLCRCGSIEWRDTTLNHPPHNGRSVRRDCAKCGRTVGFPVWYGVEDHEQ